MKKSYIAMICTFLIALGLISKAFILNESIKSYLVIFFFVGCGLGLLRIFVNNQPTFKCTSYITTNKIGLLSADEIALAGAYRNNENKKYYLYNANIY